MQRGNALNANLKSEGRIKTFVEKAGLDRVPGFTQYLSGLNVPDIAYLTDADWENILNGMPPDPALMKRVALAIKEMRAQYAKENNEIAENTALNHLINGGAHPDSQVAREARAEAARGPVDYATATFIPVAFFQGDRAGFVFKHGDEGLGYYREGAPNGGGGGGGGMQVSQSRSPSAASGPPVRRPAGYDPVSQPGIDQRNQRPSYTANAQQQLLSERRQRMQQVAY